MSETVFLTGLPRSGSTLIANLLGNHPDIYATPSSPLAHIIGNIRETYSNDQFFMSQLDYNYDNLYQKISKSTKAYIEAWSDENSKVTIDKNRGWLHQVEVLREIYPKFKMIVTLRDLRHVYASMERRHRKTSLISPLGGGHFVDSRAAAFFDNDNGIAGSALSALRNLRDVPNIISGTDHNYLFFLRYEDLVDNPQKVMSMLFDFVGVDNYEIDFNNIKQVTNESDSHYRFKYMHKINPKLEPANKDLSDISSRYAWYYKAYYSDIITQNEINNNDATSDIEYAIVEDGDNNYNKYKNDQYNTDELNSLIDIGKQQESTTQVKKSPQKNKDTKKKYPRKHNNSTITKKD